MLDPITNLQLEVLYYLYNSPKTYRELANRFSLKSISDVDNFIRGLTAVRREQYSDDYWRSRLRITNTGKIYVEEDQRREKSQITETKRYKVGKRLEIIALIISNCIAIASLIISLQSP